MQSITDLEQRITAALERIGRGVDRLPAAGGRAPVPVPVSAPAAVVAPAQSSAELVTLRGQLEAEKATTAQLQDRLRQREKDAANAGPQPAALQDKIDRLTMKLDVQGLELQRMRRTAVSLREQLHQLREAQTKGLVEPQLINKAVLVELEAFRATRLTEIAEMDEILAALEPHLKEAENA